MKVKIIGIGLVILLVGLVLPGCVSRSQFDELKAEAAGQQDQIAELESEIEEKEDRISELEKKNLEVQKEIDSLKESLTKTAEIEVTFTSNPVPCKDGMWMWRVILTELSGVGVKLNESTLLMYRQKHLLDEISNARNDGSRMGEWLNLAYLPAYGSIDFGAGWPCQDMTHTVFILSGVDDNGHEITAEGRVDFSR